MNIMFKIKIWMNPEFFDFLLCLLKPNKISPFRGSWDGYESIRLEGARLISIQELKRELQDYHKKHSGNGDIDFIVESIELTEEEKTQVDSVITFEKAIH